MKAFVSWITSYQVQTSSSNVSNGHNVGHWILLAVQFSAICYKNTRVWARGFGPRPLPLSLPLPTPHCNNSKRKKVKRVEDCLCDVWQHIAHESLHFQYCNPHDWLQWAGTENGETTLWQFDPLLCTAIFNYKWIQFTPVHIQFTPVHIQFTPVHASSHQFTSSSHQFTPVHTSGT